MTIVLTRDAGRSAQGEPIDAYSDPTPGPTTLSACCTTSTTSVWSASPVLLLGDVGRAEEVVQDSFVAIYRRWDALGDADVPAYLRQTVVNRPRSVLRHLTVVGKHPPYAPGDGPGADEDVLRGERRRAVVDALGRLPRRQREVLALRYYLDLSEREIAETLSISQGAVKSHASRGAAALRQSLNPLLEETS